ncbi:unnamed protein product [Cochlearia groenlandica]
MRSCVKQMQSWLRDFGIEPSIVLNGTDCVMFNGESVARAYPDLAVKTMAKICTESESSLNYNTIFEEMIRATPLPMNTFFLFNLDQLSGSSDKGYAL